MKTKHMVLTLLICIISFAGFSLTTTDLNQDSNYELVSLNDQGVHSVEVLFLNSEFIINFNQERLIIDKHVFINKEFNLSNEKSIRIVNLYHNEENILQPPEEDIIKLNTLQKALSKTKIFIYRSARDGLQICS